MIKHRNISAAAGSTIELRRLSVRFPVRARFDAVDNHPRSFVHIDKEIEQIGRVLFQLREPRFQIGGILGSRGDRQPQYRTAQGRGQFRHQFLAGIGRIPEDEVRRTIQPNRMSRFIRYEAVAITSFVLSASILSW